MRISCPIDLKTPKGAEQWKQLRAWELFRKGGSRLTTDIIKLFVRVGLVPEPLRMPSDN